MKKEKLLVINPGSTSTKVAVYEGEQAKWVESISHSLEEIQKYRTVFDQLDMRKNLIQECMEKHGDTLDSIDGIASRGGAMPPVCTGAYEVNDYMVDCLHYHAQDQHASNVGAAIALDFAKEIGVKAYTYDAITVDEMSPINIITGLKGMRRQSRGHNLNTRAAALKLCREKQISYQDTNIIVAHLGGGITINLHSGGKIVDVIMDGEGPFSPERAGGLPSYAVVNMVYGKKDTKEEMMKQLQRRGGMVSYFGTADMREVEAMIQDGNEEAKLVFEAMALAVAKNIAKIAPSAYGKIDYIILTGGLAYSKRFTDWVSERVGFLAPIELIPGENEMESLAQGILRVMRGEEQANVLTPNQ
ncbi:butyrate kinase [Lachnospiraceae bacterium ZAX-1]